MTNRNEVEETDKLRTSLNLRLSKCDERLSRLTDAYIDQMIDKDTFEARKRGLYSERRALLDQIANLSARDLPRGKAFKNLELGNAAYSGYISGNIPERRNIVGVFTSNLRVRGKTPAITLRSPYEEIANWRKTQNGAPSRNNRRQRARELLDVIVEVDRKEENAAVADWSARRKPRRDPRTTSAAHTVSEKSLMSLRPSPAAQPNTGGLNKPV
ncbi:MAG: hypothetical protein ACREHE_00890 [Rhizomicrobium sp.]